MRIDCVSEEFMEKQVLRALLARAAVMAKIKVLQIPVLAVL